MDFLFVLNCYDRGKVKSIGYKTVTFGRKICLRNIWLSCAYAFQNNVY